MSSTTTDDTTTPSDAEIHDVVVAWYRALDRHDPLDEVLPYLVDDGLELVFPETTEHGHEGFARWYEAVTHRFFDEEHTVTSVTTERTDDRTVDVRVVVNWQAYVWEPPGARSAWLGFDAFQTWQVVAGPDGRPRVQRYVVDWLVPMPGSASL